MEVDGGDVDFLTLVEGLDGGVVWRDTMVGKELLDEFWIVWGRHAKKWKKYRKSEKIIDMVRELALA